MKENIFTRLLWHLQRAIERRRAAQDEIEEEYSPEEIAASKEENDREWQAWLARCPTVDCQKTIVFYSEPHEWWCNFLTAWYYRIYIRAVYNRAVADGITTFVTNYSTPLGLLAQEVLVELRRSGEKFHLYTFRDRCISKRKTFRLVPEITPEMAYWILSSDYQFFSIDQAELILYILNHAQKICTEHGVWRRKSSSAHQ